MSNIKAATVLIASKATGVNSGERVRENERVEECSECEGCGSSWVTPGRTETDS